MDEEKTTTDLGQGKKRDRSNKALLALVVLLLLTNAAMLFMLMKGNKEGERKEQRIENLTDEKENVTSLLEDMLAQYDTLDTQNDTLNAEIEAQKAQITDLLAQVEKNKDDKWLIYKYKKEAGTLRDIMKGYVVTIDSLNQMNLALQAENVSMTQELGEVKGQKEALESQTEEMQGRIEQGSVLHTGSISAGAMFLRSSGKQVETNRSKKAEMIKCCFNLGANRITESGERIMYLRIISPDGKVLPAADPNNRFKFGGVEGEYSVKRSINYQNQAVDVCIFWTANGEMTSGQYIVQVYDQGKQIAKTEFTLK